MNQPSQNFSRQPYRAGGLTANGRAPLEYYPTPTSATQAFLDAEEFSGSIWEPACGEGAISKVLIGYGYDVISTDIADYDYGTPGIDFLTEVVPRARNIVTNPPYGSGLADAFLRQALRMIAETGGTVAMLLNIQSLCHPKRHSSFIKRPPRAIYALDDCICWPNGNPQLATRHTKNHRYCWALWDATPSADTTFKWLSTTAYQQEGWAA